ncbi:sigma-70 family RNA polymerase sigma factor [Luteolibacter pohnpeiensis]|uniref:Sigma-70 family RNA polymerase sigma factor n=2 Tax=Luteolibacter pohnpeiensis TaxID=454153 RepID=A0A934S261_9BACT|nr:sigma-70 family RNA polymerase sigma factor [Luteolibacter pohnpeiensis]
MMDESTEKTLINASKLGDIAAFDELVKSNQASIRAYFRMRVFDWAAADDLAQEVFLTAYKRLGTFRGEARFGAWTRGIASNHLRNWLRQRRDEPVGGGEELQSLFTSQIDLSYQFESSVEPEPEEAVMLAALDNCLSKLGRSARSLLDERYHVGKTVREIADGTSRGYSAIVMQLLRIRKILATCIRQQLGPTR